MDSIRELLRPAAQMSDDMSIVEANFDDPVHAAAIVDLLDHYAQERMGIGRPLSDDVKQSLVPRLRDHPTSFALLAFLGGEPAGVAVCFVGFSTFQALPLVNVHDLCVKRSVRGRRIGREILRRVEEKAQSLGCGKITLEVRDDNDRALNLYESAGFDGRRSRDGRPRTLFLEKPLARPR
jgi:GNAT superfamily N-acetyltransferase